MSLITRLSDFATAVKTETKALRTILTGTNNGDASGLDTTSTNVIGAINEVKAIADAAAGGGAAVNDGVTNTTDAWSGQKITNDIAAARAALKAEILDGAAAEVDTLVEIANLLSQNETSDAALAAVVANKANASDVYTQAEIGDPETDLVAIWTAA